jgi:hypothetical protein
MPPPSPPTLTRIDPAYPLLWRDVDTVQFGLDARVVVPLSEPWIEPLLQAMRDGFRIASFDVLAHGLGAPRDAARALLQTLEPLLRPEQQPLPPIWIESVNLSDSRVQTRIEHALIDEGFTTVPRGTRNAVGIVLVHGAASAHQLAGYLRDDLTHLPVAFEPGSTTVGPMIVPGTTPCLSCRDAHERDQDAAWPRMHAQLIGATAVAVTPVRTIEAAALVARLLGEHDGAKLTKSVRISDDGRRLWSEARFHADCRCRDQTSRSLQGTAKDAVPLARTNATTTDRAFLRRA